MIISFRVENWRSFRDSATLYMSAGPERQHRDRLPFVKKFRLRLLPIAAIYGANASGKSAFLNALEYLQSVVLDGAIQSRMLPQFKLNSSAQIKPSRFEIKLLIDEKIFTYTLSVFPDRIAEESLQLENSTSIYDLFVRKENKSIVFDEDSFKGDKLALLRLIEKSVDRNQLFLTNAHKLGVKEFSPICKWFAERLIVIHPSSKFQPIERFADPDDVLGSHTSKLMQTLDTGIDHFVTMSSDIGTIPQEVEEMIKRSYKQSAKHLFRFNDLIIRLAEGGELKVERLLSVHKNRENQDITFRLQEESDGTVRLLDLIPVFEILKNQDGRTVLIDELDRSLHTHLLEWLIKDYLTASGPNQRNQLIFTAHDVNLLTQSLFRRDELVRVQKGRDGASVLNAFSDFEDVRSDKDIRKLYLNGFLGGVPYILD